MPISLLKGRPAASNILVSGRGRQVMTTSLWVLQAVNGEKRLDKLITPHGESEKFN